MLLYLKGFIPEDVETVCTYIRSMMYKHSEQPSTIIVFDQTSSVSSTITQCNI